MDRLRQRDTILRTSADASLLVESLIDLSLYLASLIVRRDLTFFTSVVDNALEIVEEYQSKILKLEQSILLKPTHVHRCT